MAGLLEGRVVMVSGVGPGLGRSLALGAAREGASVALLARSAERLEAVAAEIAHGGGTALVVPTDVTDEDAWRACAATAVHEEWGRIDGLANNAFAQPPFEPLSQVVLSTARDSFDINVLAHLSLTRVVAPYMTAAGGGSVVMTNSSTLRRARARLGTYKMAKHALLGLARTLATELGPDGIRVNTIAPGYIYDQPVKDYFAWLAAEQGRTPAEVEAEVTATHPLGWIPTPDAIADVAVFLFSDLARAVTGQCIDVNGGEYMI